MAETSALPTASPQAKAEPAFSLLLLPPRFFAAGAVVAAEILLFAALGHPWLPTGQIATGPIVFLAALLFFGRRRLRASGALEAPLNYRFLAAHATALVTVLALQVVLLRSTSDSPALVVGWIAALLATLVTMLCALIPPRALSSLTRTLGSTWIYAFVCAIVVVFARSIELVLWNAADSTLGSALANIAFSSSRFALGLFYSNVVAEPATRLLGTDVFQVRVAGACSGIEGLSLTLVFLVAWMIFERRHLRLSRAALLIPVALAFMWLLNIARLTALIAIGDHGHERLALTGFHTEAGWIAFTAVTVGILLVASRTAWFQREAITAPAATNAVPQNIALPYLAPFLAILATSLLTGAISTSGFEPLYPLRFFACAAVLFAVRKQLTLPRASDATQLAVATTIGTAIGIAWIFTARSADNTIATGLADLSGTSRTFWLLARTLAAIITVPIAEELAFRGFLARLLTSPSAPESVSYRQLSLPAILLSSIAFGLMHGHLWPIATLSGIAFAWLARRSNSLIPAIAAHAAANVALAVFALTTHSYSVW